MKKIELYKTARTVLGCAKFGIEECVRVRYLGDKDGVHWFTVWKKEGEEVAYPEHHLKEFCL